MGLRSKLARLEKAGFGDGRVASDEADPAPVFEDSFDGGDAVTLPSRFSCARDERMQNAAATAEPPPASLEDLRSRMQRILERHASKAKPLPPRVDADDLPFASEETARGTRHIRQVAFGASHRVGAVPIAPARRADQRQLAMLALDPSLADCDLQRALFLDTETTGLSGGTGTVAFLVGTASFSDNAPGTPGTLVVEQMLVRNLGEEGPMLARLRDQIEAASMLVTFNGKSFDMPLLRTRFALARVPLPAEPPHLDLLHVARRIHGKGSARLVHIEERILGFVRVGDIPSGEVSEAYLHFLRSGDATSLLAVVEHNVWDVVTMAALVGLYGETEDRSRHSPEAGVGIARTLRRAGEKDAAQSWLDDALERGAGGVGYEELGTLEKARGARDRALRAFESAIATVDSPRARLELAKLYEHHAKDPSRALAMVESGTGEADAHRERRRNRLLKKLAKPA